MNTSWPLHLTLPILQYVSLCPGICTVDAALGVGGGGRGDWRPPLWTKYRSGVSMERVITIEWQWSHEWRQMHNRKLQCAPKSYSPKMLLIKTEPDFPFAGAKEAHTEDAIWCFCSNETSQSEPSAIHYCKCQNDRSLRASDHLSAFTKDLRNHLCCSFPVLVFPGKARWKIRYPVLGDNVAHRRAAAVTPQRVCFPQRRFMWLQQVVRSI